jgi:hypothetical protein
VNFSDLYIRQYNVTEIHKLKVALSQFVSNKKFETIVKTNWGSYLNDQKYSEILVERIVEIYDLVETNVKNLAMSNFSIPLKNINYYRRGIYKGDNVWLLFSRTNEFDFRKEVGIWFKNVVERRKIVQSPSAVIQPDIIDKTKETFNGRCAFCFPKMWLMKLPDPSLKKRLDNLIFEFMLTRKPVATVNGKQVLVENDGLIIVEDNRQFSAERFFNSLFFAFLINKIGATVVRSWEIGSINFSEGESKSQGGMFPVNSERNLQYEDRHQNGNKILNYNRRRLLISTKTLLKCLKICEAIERNSALYFFAFYSLEAYSHYFRKEFTQAFIFSWIIIERDLVAKWDKFLENENADKERKKKLKDYNYVTVDHYLEILLISKQIKPSDYSELMRLKKLRNGIAHKAEKIGEDDSKKCMNIAIWISKNRYKEFVKAGKHNAPAK